MQRSSVNRATMRGWAATVSLAVLAVCLCCTLALAGPGGSAVSGDGDQSMTPAGQLPAALEGIGFDQNLGASVNPDLEFTDSDGKRVRLGDYFGDKPVVLSLVYYDCPMLCTMELNGLVKALRAIVKLSPGEDFEIVTVSFDPGETPSLAASKKTGYLESLRREGAEEGWHFLVGDEAAISELADTVGFRYRYDPETDLYRHASGIVTLTPDGVISRYQFGVEYSARDLQFALIEASDHAIGSFADAVMLYCFHYDPVTGKYGLVVMNALRVGGAATVLGLAAIMLVGFLRDRRDRATA